MRIEYLEILNFRNLQHTHIDIEAPFIVLSGPNAQGKTNILEALYLCATGRSFRYATPREMIAHCETTSTVHCQLVRQGVRHHVAVKLAQQRKHMHVDGKGLKHIAKLLQMINVVAFFPADLDIIKGAPEMRRRFLDRVAAGSKPDFVNISLRYHTVLRARNHLLRSPAVPDKHLLATYDTQIAHDGFLLQTERVACLEHLAKDVAQHFHHVMPQAGLLTLGLSGLIAPDTWLAALKKAYPQDRARGITSIGPHRMDMCCAIDGHDSRMYASQGQQRAIVLALKMAEVSYLTKRLQAPPILLLDDVSSELDAERTRLLFESIRSLNGQVWITSTEAKLLPLDLADTQQTQRMHVCNGGVLRSA